jgi:hypothetical protein
MIWILEGDGDAWRRVDLEITGMPCMDCSSTFANDVGQRVFIRALWRSVKYKKFFATPKTSSLDS